MDTVSNKSQLKEALLKSPSDRLKHILDKVQFKQGRGRIDEFQRFLQMESPEMFGALKYTTVQSWFNESAPRMKAVESIIDLLSTKYVFNCDVSQVKSYWKVGGYYPFTVDKKVSESDSKIKSELKIDSVYIGQVYLLVYETASTLDFNLMSVEREVQRNIFDKVLQYCSEKEVLIDSIELKELVRSLLLLAKEGLL